MEAHTRFNTVMFNWLRTLLKIVGHDIFGGDKFERNFITFLIYGMTCAFIVMIVYTFLFYDLLAKIFAMLFFFLVIQVILTLL